MCAEESRLCKCLCKGLGTHAQTLAQLSATSGGTAVYSESDHDNPLCFPRCVCGFAIQGRCVGDEQAQPVVVAIDILQLGFLSREYQAVPHHTSPRDTI